MGNDITQINKRPNITIIIASQDILSSMLPLDWLKPSSRKENTERMEEGEKSGESRGRDRETGVQESKERKGGKKHTDNEDDDRIGSDNNKTPDVWAAKREASDAFAQTPCDPLLFRPNMHHSK